jgi:hypothetical protein
MKHRCTGVLGGDGADGPVRGSDASRCRGARHHPGFDYKDIDEVMAAQRDLVEPLARFDPRLVKMAPSGEPRED